MLIGYWGYLMFAVNSDWVQYPTNVTRNVGARYETHYTANGNRPYKEFLGAAHDTLTFTMHFDSRFSGGDVRKLLDLLTEITHNGYAGVLVIGNKPVGYEKWVCTSNVQKWAEIQSDGFIASADVDVTLEEYGD